MYKQDKLEQNIAEHFLLVSSDRFNDQNQSSEVRTLVLYYFSNTLPKM